MLSYLLALAISNPWAMVHSPSKGSAEPIGSYSAGCLQGAQMLPLKSDFYQVLRPSQHRYYGHPDLIRFINSLTQRAHRQQLPPLLVGDMAMARGGPFASGHRSHQIGLDVDFWFRFAKPRLSARELDTPQPLDMVRSDNRHVSNSFTAQQATLLKLAASDPHVERIFVHPAIKKALCLSSSAQRPWLRKIRPWYGHRAHFHVRLYCPYNAPDCQPQKPIPAGEGCGPELDSWFAGQTEVSKQSHPNPLPMLPGRCEELLD